MEIDYTYVVTIFLINTVLYKYHINSITNKTTQMLKEERSGIRMDCLT